MRQLRLSNEILGNQSALAAAWERDGYWFFRDVLDHGVIGRLREVYLTELANLGVVDAGDPVGRHNGADLG